MLVAVTVPLLDGPRTMICSPTVRSLTLPVFVTSTVVDADVDTVTLDPLVVCTVIVEPFTAVTVPIVGAPPWGPLPLAALAPLGLEPDWLGGPFGGPPEAPGPFELEEPLEEPPLAPLGACWPPGGPPEPPGPDGFDAVPLSTIWFAVTDEPDVEPSTTTWSPTLTSLSAPFTASVTVVDADVCTVSVLLARFFTTIVEPLMLWIVPPFPPPGGPPRPAGPVADAAVADELPELIAFTPTTAAAAMATAPTAATSTLRRDGRLGCAGRSAGSSNHTSSWASASGGDAAWA